MNVPVLRKTCWVWYMVCMLLIVVNGGMEPSIVSKVNNFEDNYFPTADYCTGDISANKLCNLRSAWLYCQQRQAPCVIELPSRSTITMRREFGSSLELHSDDHIVSSNGFT
jgi:hypothetical protein